MRYFRIFPALFILFAACTQKGKPVTKDEALATAKFIDSCIRDGKPVGFNDLFSPALLAARIARQAGKRVNEQVINGVKSGLSQNNIGRQIIEFTSKNGFYELVKYYEKDKTQHLIFRMYGDGGLNYHDFELDRYKGKVMIADLFIYLSGENFSKTLSDLVMTMNERKRTADMEMDEVTKIKRLMGQHRHEEAKKVFDALPASLKDQKMMQLTYIQICSQLDEPVYIKALNEFQSLYPNEPNMFLALIDANLLRKDYSKALECVNQMDALINKDPFLDYYRALMYKLMEKKTESGQYLEKLAANMPYFDDGVLELIVNYLDAGSFDNARRLVKAYRENSKFDQQSLTYALNLYPAFSE
jgi:hypothetical protein